MGTLPVRAAAMTLDRPPNIACIGLSSWDRLIAVPEYPAVGEQADVLEEVSAPGGTTTNTAVALARLGADVSIATAVGDDERGASLRRSLEAAGVDTGWLTVKPVKTDLATVIVSQQAARAHHLRRAGAQLSAGRSARHRRAFRRGCPGTRRRRRFFTALPGRSAGSHGTDGAVLGP